MGSKKKKEGKEAEDEHKSVPFFKLFSFADRRDVLLMVVGSIGAAVNGAALPLITVIFGQLSNAFGENANSSDVVDKVSSVSLRFVWLGCGSAVASFLEIACWMCTGERQAARIRSLYLEAILRQDISFFDTETSTGEVISRMSGDTVLVQSAMGEKVGQFIQLMTTFVAAFVIAFFKGWLLTLVMISALPLLVAAGSAMSLMFTRMASKGQAAYAEAGKVVEQITSGIRTVASFTGEQKALTEYERKLDDAYKAGKFEGGVTGLGLAVALFVMFCSYALAMWYGSKLILNHGYNGGDVLSVIFAVLTGGMSLGQLSPSVSAFAAGKAAAYKMFDVIHRKPGIDAFDESGITPVGLRGDIELREVSFAYPARLDVPIFDSFCLSIPSGQTAALVGESGSGKSTVISLIERFYDPQAGQVLIDGTDIRNFQLKWIRQQIGLVSQEPVLFATSIRENISFGKQDATEAEIKEAARLANALKFIDKLPQGYDTQVGEHGTQLSGGQKQRVAIARAIVKNPCILLLDEATSALDAESERLVQQALDRVMQNRTTVIVAHRLSTIRNADMITVIQRGSIVERGTHVELIKRPQGAYSQLVRLQETHQEKLNETVLTSVDPDEIAAEGRLSTSSRSSFGSKRSRKISRSSFSLTRTLSWKATVQDAEAIPEPKPASSPNNILRLVALSKPEAPILMLGILGATGNGVIFPIFGLLLSSIIATFYETDRHKLRKDASFWAGMFTVIAAACLIVIPAQFGSFGLAGQRLIRRIRRLCFENTLRQEVAWFEEPENASGAIGARLSMDATYVKSMVGDTLSMATQNIATITAGLVIAFSANWILALVILALVPLLGLHGITQTKVLTGFGKDAKSMYEQATKIASEAVSSIRTVASYCLERKMISMYKQRCGVSERSGIRTGIVSGMSLGVSNFVSYSAYALSFWFGAQLVKDHKTTFKNVFRVFFAISMSALSVSQTITMSPDFAKVKLAVAAIFKLLDRKSAIDPSDTGKGKTLESVRGEVQFQHVSFRYPSRPEVPIFQDLCLTIEAGKSVALVGESGSGKSTAIALLERFYDAEGGRITLDGVDIRELQLRWLRRRMALVSQEPLLFNGSIRENISYGYVQQGQEEEEGGVAVREAEVAAAVAAAGAAAMVAALPAGLETVVGERGVQLSGGQKQRVAIARALLRRPAVLLLDEATSALDAESEAAVQGALHTATRGGSGAATTVLVVAHRLSTIVGVDAIAVLSNGGIAEMGSHEELLATRPTGAYAALLRLHSASASSAAVAQPPAP